MEHILHVLLFSFPFLGLCPRLSSERAESEAQRLIVKYRLYKTTPAFPVTVWGHTPRRVCFPSAHRDHSPSRGYSVLCLPIHQSMYPLRGCMPRCRVDITHGKELPVKFRKPQVTWLLTCTIHRHNHPYTFCYKKTNVEREGLWAGALSNLPPEWLRQHGRLWRLR